MKHEHERRSKLAVQWPDTPFRVSLVEPEIPPNTGNIARLCAATGSPLHLVEPLGFKLTDAALKRAGLDYWESVTLIRHASYERFAAAVSPARLFFFSTQGEHPYTAARYEPGDVLVFGSESKGLPAELLASNARNVLTIPVRTECVRSLNLATAVGIVLYEALRQTMAGIVQNTQL